MFNKKAIESHILILLAISGIMTILFVFIIGGIFKSDPKECVDLDFEVVGKCKKDDFIQFSIRNDAEKRFFFEINGEYKEDYSLIAGESKPYRILREKDLEITPMLKINGEMLQCRGKIAKEFVESATLCAK